jgi:hypothetical protein
MFILLSGHSVEQSSLWRVGELGTVKGFLSSKVELFLLPFLAVDILVLHLGRS